VSKNSQKIKKVLVTGGAGYIGSVLVPKLLKKGYQVRVLDLYLYGEDVFDEIKNHPGLKEIRGDLRDPKLVNESLAGIDAVIHLACISNDPSFELNPNLGKSINYDSFPHLVKISKEKGVKRFVFASSSSVYGIKEDEKVTEDLPLEPLTDYSRFKALCEEILEKERAPGFVTVIFRPATVCGYSPRLRLDLTVNTLTNHAVNNGKIKVFGGTQKRPNIHIGDVTDLYVNSLEWPKDLIDGEIFNVGYENHKVSDIAEMVRSVVNPKVKVETTPTDDLRSYHISSEKIKNRLGFEPKRSVKEAVKDLLNAFNAGKIKDPLTNKRYYNIQTMQSVNLV